ncbi:MAG: cation transporter [Verrucomicrobiaceae bacterium]|nr:cation transporter [Verrucomicrobiaceae bacterium]
MKEKDFAAMLSVVAAGGLTLAKIVVGVATGSLGIISEALHSALDLLAAGMTWFAVKLSDKPADKEHNFGHGKIENLSALFESVLLLATCVWVIYEAISRLYYKDTAFSLSAWAFAVVVVSIIVDFFRSRHLMNTAKKYNSQALEADALHFSIDMLSSFVVLIGLVASYLGYDFADSIAALGVSVIVAWVSLKLSYRAINALLDTAPVGIVEQIDGVLSSISDIKKWHDLRVRSNGCGYEIDINIHVKPNLTLVEAHEISERLENEIRTLIGVATINVHVEPDD